MRTFWWGVTLLAAVVFAVFAISNRQAVSLGLWPLPYLVEVPLFFVVLVTLLIGFLFGELAAWVAGRRWRRKARRRARRIEALERELAATQAQLADESRTASAGVPPRARVPVRG